MRQGVFKSPSWFPPPDSWLDLGRLDKIRLAFHHEYYRLATALTLHSDASHLAGNILFGAVFLFALAKIIGPGRAFLLAIIGGVCGNYLSVQIHSFSYISVGFSTAVFAALGLIAGVTARRDGSKRRLLLLAGGTIGLLAMLGAEGARSDYAAHILGLLSGALLGLYEGWRRKISAPALSQALSAAAGLGLLALAWLAAFGAAPL